MSLMSSRCCTSKRLPLCRYKYRILFVHSFKEKSQFSKSDKNETDIKQPDTKTTISIVLGFFIFIF